MVVILTEEMQLSTVPNLQITHCCFFTATENNILKIVTPDSMKAVRHNHPLQSQEIPPWHILQSENYNVCSLLCLLCFLFLPLPHFPSFYIMFTENSSFLISFALYFLASTFPPSSIPFSMLTHLPFLFLLSP